jgi:hypothetical protein
MSCDPKAIEDREQQQRVFGWLSNGFSFFYKETCALRSRLSFRCSMPFDLHERGYERDLELDLFATKRGRNGQCRNLGKGVSELFFGLDKCGSCQ